MDTAYIILIWGIVWGIVCQAIGSSKNIKGGFFWGFFLGFIGLIVVACSKGKEEKTQINLSTDNSNNQIDKYEQLEKLSKLKDSGVISDSEFESEKNKLLK